MKNVPRGVLYNDTPGCKGSKVWVQGPGSGVRGPGVQGARTSFMEAFARSFKITPYNLNLIASRL